MSFSLCRGLWESGGGRVVHLVTVAPGIPRQGTVKTWALARGKAGREVPVAP